MKNIGFIWILVFAGNFAFGQIITIIGTVKDQQEQPVPLAFIRDAQHNYATYADSSGQFVIKADPASFLIASAKGFDNTRVKIDNKTNINISMAKGAAAGLNTGNEAGQGQQSNGTSFLSNQQVVSQTAYSQSAKEGFNQEPTRGSPYLFNSWRPGFAINKTDSLFHDDNNLYNYDKTTGDILFTRDNITIMKVDKQQVKTFNLYSGKVYPDIFENLPAVNNKSFIPVILSTSKYKIYKNVDTKLIRANFHSDGVIESGHRYDEYVDNVQYYFVKLPADKPKQFSLKKKNLKELLEGDADKFISAQGDRDVDDDYLRDLNYSLNQ
jgi:hypothetical protein